MNVRKTALDGVVSIENNKSTLIDKLIECLNDEEYCIRYVAAEALGKKKIKRFLESEPVKKDKILKELEYQSEFNEYHRIRLSLRKAIAQITNEAPPVNEFINLIKSDDKKTKQVAAQALGSLKENAKNTLPELEKILKEEEESVRLYLQIAIDRIRGLFPTIAFLEYLKTDDKSVLALTLSQFLAELMILGLDSNMNEESGISLLIEVLEKNLSDSNLSSISLEIIIKILEKDKVRLADILIQVLDLNRTKLGIRVALELESLAPELIGLIGQKALPKLRKLQYAEDGQEIEAITKAIRTIEAVMKPKPILQAEILLENLKTEISLQEKADIIRTLVEQACSSEPLRLLLKEWVNWIAEEKETFLTSMTVDVLREQKLAVLPLISLLEYLKYYWQPTEKLNKKIRQKAEQEVKQMTKRQTNREYDDDLLVEQKITEQIKNRKQNIEMRIFQLIAEMSDQKFIIRVYKNDPAYEEYERIYLEIKDELSKHATPVLARRLVNESNSKICELITLILANNGGFYATNALASRTHYDRKELLTEYYLKPSKKQSEDAAKILKDTVKASRTTLLIQQGLNVAMFAVGLVLIIGALITGIKSETTKEQQVAAGLAGASGLGGMLFHFVSKPLERIQNSLADMVQAETAFTSYIWELNLNSAFIQSQYMENGVLSNDEIDCTVERTQKVTNLTLEWVNDHLEQNKQPPSSGTDNSKIIHVEYGRNSLEGKHSRF